MFLLHSIIRQPFSSMILKLGNQNCFRKSEAKFDPAAFETKQVFFKSKDGTKVPMFLSYRKGMKLDGS